MARFPDERSEAAFSDFKDAYTPAQAVVEANRCLFCHDAPCIQVCPTSIDIPQFIRKIATGNLKSSARTIFESNILGTSCARVCPVEVLCVGDCVYNEMGIPPIQIGKLQRTATDKALEAGWQFFEAGADTGKSVGCIGGGPASLAAAHELRRRGHAVTIYERHDYLGGLNTDGVAPYKMRADDVAAEIDWVMAIGGIEVRHGAVLGDNLGFGEVEAAHDAVFLGVGLGPDKALGLPGEDLAGIDGAVDWIARMKTGTVDLSGVERAIVVGGGNTAIDAVRELIGLGVPEVTMVYRGNEENKSGYAHEWVAGKAEGARAAWHTQPVGVVGEAGRVTALRCVRTDDNKRNIAGSEHDLAADLVLVAIGQSKLGALFGSIDGIEVKWGQVVTDDDGATGRPGVYAGGDCRNGGKEVVNAAAEGKAAARAIHALLTGASAPADRPHPDHINHGPAHA